MLHVLLLLAACAPPSPEPPGDSEPVPVDSAPPEPVGVLRIEPEILDFGLVEPGCTVGGVVRLENTGDAALTLSALEESRTGEALTLDRLDNGPLPWTLNPGDHRDLLVSFRPTAEGRVSQALRVRTDLAGDPARDFEQLGEGAYARWVTDTHVQGESTPIDVLISLDGSTSMQEWLPSVEGELLDWMGELSDSTADFHVGVIIADDSCIAGPPDAIRRGRSEAELEAALLVMLDTYTLHLGEQALQRLDTAAQQFSSGGCNADFYRPDGHLALVAISDEDDQSPALPSDYLNAWVALKGNPDLVSFHAIASPPPAGCERLNPALAFDDLVQATGGSFTALCGGEFVGPLTAIAERTESREDHFELSELPEPLTLEVRVDGAPATGWRYASVDNAVRFDPEDLPPAGALIEVRYAAAGSCTP